MGKYLGRVIRRGAAAMKWLARKAARWLFAGLGFLGLWLFVECMRVEKRLDDES